MAKTEGKRRRWPRSLSTREARTFRSALDLADPRPSALTGTRDEKKNYAQRLSHQIAILIADHLRHQFPTILPDSQGRGSESRARTAKGVKKLDVNYSTPELGLGLGVSVKTINFPDLKKKKTKDADGTVRQEVVLGRYTKNYTRADNELRAEAQDYHLRQPYAVMVAVIFIPADSMRQQEEQTRPSEGRYSSFAQAVRVFRHRAGRKSPKDLEELFERVFLGAYEHEGEARGDVWFFDVMEKPKRFGAPRKTLTFEEMIQEIIRTFDERNNPPFEWDLNGEGEENASSPEQSS